MPHVETDAGGGVSVGFDRKAVIFEDAYDNSLSPIGRVVPSRDVV